MATKKLEDITITKPSVHTLTDEDILNPKAFPIEKLLAQEYFNKYIKQNGADVIVPTTEEERIRIEELVRKRVKKGEEPELLNRYLDSIGRLRFISEERYQAAKEIYDYEINMKERATEHNGKQGYRLTEYEAVLCHFRKLFKELGIEDIVLGKKTILIEARAVHIAAEGYRTRIKEAEQLRNIDGITKQAYLKTLREEIQALMIQQNVKPKSAKLLTRQLIKLLS